MVIENYWRYRSIMHIENGLRTLRINTNNLCNGSKYTDLLTKYNITNQHSNRRVYLTRSQQRRKVAVDTCMCNQLLFGWVDERTPCKTLISLFVLSIAHAALSLCATLIDLTTYRRCRTAQRAINIDHEIYTYLFSIQIIYLSKYIYIYMKLMNKKYKCEVIWTDLIHI